MTTTDNTKNSSETQKFHRVNKKKKKNIKSYFLFHTGS